MTVRSALPGWYPATVGRPPPSRLFTERILGSNAEVSVACDLMSWALVAAIGNARGIAMLRISSQDTRNKRRSIVEGKRVARLGMPS